MSITSINLNRMLDDAIAFVPSSQVVALDAFSTIFKGDLGTNQTVTVPVIGEGGAVAQYDSTTNNWGAVKGSNTGKVELILPEPLKADFSLTRSDIDNLGDRGVQELLRERIVSLCDKVATTVFAEVKAANFSDVVKVGPTNNNFAKNLLYARNAADGRGEKVIVLNDGATIDLLRDLAISSDDRSQRDALAAGAVASIGGMKVYETTLLTPESNIIGFTTNKSGIAVATGVRNVGDWSDVLGSPAANVTYQNTAYDDATGLTVGLVAFVDPNTNTLKAAFHVSVAAKVIASGKGEKRLVRISTQART